MPSPPRQLVLNQVFLFLGVIFDTRVKHRISFSMQFCFTTTTKQNNHTTQHALGQRSAEILKNPLRGNTCCFPQDRNLDTGFIGIGQCSGLRTLYKSNASTFISSDSYSLSEDISDAGGSDARHHSHYSTNFQEVCMSLSLSSGCVSVNEFSMPSITGNFHLPTLNLFL